MSEVSAQVQVLALAHGGASICSARDAGKKVFVRYAIPGEDLEVRIDTEEKNFCTGTLLRVITPSPARVTPPCPYFGACGGCDAQQIEITKQRALKLAMIRDALRYQAGVKTIEPVLRGAELPAFSYRNRIGLHLSAAGVLGFYRPGTREALKIDECLICDATINSALTALQPLAKELAPTIAKIVVEHQEREPHLVLNVREEFGPNDPALAEAHALLSRSFRQIRFICGGQEIFFGPRTAHPAGHFSQVNAAGNQILIQLVLGHLDNTPLTELYAGSGNFTIPLAAKGIEVTAVEIDQALVDYARSRLTELGLSSRVRFEISSCEKYVRSAQLAKTVLLDPPRIGAKEIVKRIDPQHTARVIYVSCGLPTLCRDVQILGSRGFELKSIEFVDMFPQTHHVETVSIFEAN